MNKKLSLNIIKHLSLFLAIIMILSCFPSAVAAAETDKAGLDKKKLTLHAGGTYTLTLTGDTAVSWKSSKKSVATVTSKGKIKAKKKGTAVITCKTASGKKYKCKVTVKKHIYKTVKKVAATKNKKGYTVYKCDECSKTYRETTVYDPKESQVRSDLMAMKKKYPEGTRWTINYHYTWGPEKYYAGMTCVGYGCVGFAFKMSDAAYGKYNKSRKISGKNWYKKIRVGDIIRVENNSHSVVVLKRNKNSITVVEGAYNNSVHWGRKISMSEIKKKGSYLITRYPK